MRIGWIGLPVHPEQAVTPKEPARGKAQPECAVVGRARKPSRLPDRARGFFGHRTFRHAA